MATYCAAEADWRGGEEPLLMKEPSIQWKTEDGLEPLCTYQRNKLDAKMGKSKKAEVQEEGCGFYSVQKASPLLELEIRYLTIMDRFRPVFSGECESSLFL